MIRLATFLFSVFILTAFANDKSRPDKVQKMDILRKAEIKMYTSIEVLKNDTVFKLDFFKSIPDTISGCGDYFTYDTTKVADDKYIFLSNLTEFAIIRIKGRVIYLNKDNKQSRELSKDSYIEVFKTKGYKAILRVKKLKTYDEGGFYKGTLEMISDPIRAIFKVHGEAGC
jgi:hypothetical protein